MTAILATLITLAVSYMVIRAGYTSMFCGTAGMTSFACPIMFLLYQPSMEMALGILIYGIVCIVMLTAACSYFASSNHFIISLDIAYLFSMLMLVFFQTFKLNVINPTANQA